ncbi:MAG: hypothetical protein KGI37_03920 [Alphaproteobacteria bacterium]|nr:hypothetical protein [Alphaproteobacteria bacterium]
MALQAGAARAQTATAEPLRVVKSAVNAEADNAEFCLDFDHPPAPVSTSRLLAALHLEKNGKTVVPQNIVLSGSGLCLFPLDRGQSYHLSFATAGLRAMPDATGAASHGEKRPSTYRISFKVPDRVPALSFLGTKEGVSGFVDSAHLLDLRAINLAAASIRIYRLTDRDAMAQAWQNRSQVALAPSESAYLARTKGTLVWKGDIAFANKPNTAQTQDFSLNDKIPDAAGGLYLVVASAPAASDVSSGQGLAPLAAAWVTKSNFSLQAMRDADGVHVFATTAPTPKNDVRIIALNRQSASVAEAHSDKDGNAFLKANGDIASVLGIDDAGNVAFADVTALPPLSPAAAPGLIVAGDPLTPPSDTAALTLSLPDAGTAGSSTMTVSRAGSDYATFPVPALVKGNTALSFPAPARQGVWRLDWRKNDSSLIATAPLRITDNPDAPRLSLGSDAAAISASGSPQITVKAVTATGKPAGFIDGQVAVAWQNRDMESAAWKNYQFGTLAAQPNTPDTTTSFVMPPNGMTQLHLPLPPIPTEPGLYQAVVTAQAAPDEGVAPSPSMILPLRPTAATVGIKPLVINGRFSQNGVARFALIALSTDEKPCDLSNLTYQFYEEGRSFDWYPDNGQWQYRREPQLRPIGGGALSIKADGSSILEWPVTAGNYRLEIFDANGKLLAQNKFSAAWDNGKTSLAALPVTMPPKIEAGHSADIRFTLPAPAMVTAVIADTHIRQVIHTFRPKGDNVISFTPANDWQDGVSVTVRALMAAPNGVMTAQQGTAQAAMKRDHGTIPAAVPTGVVIMSASNPPDIVLRRGDHALLTFGVENREQSPVTLRYGFTAQPGLKIEQGEAGTIRLGARQSQSLRLDVTGTQTGIKVLKLDLAAAEGKKDRISASWPLAVMPRHAALDSTDETTVTPRRELVPAAMRGHAAAIFVARTPKPGLAELLCAVFNGRPFTTSELAMGVNALQQWDDVIARSGIAPGDAVAARQQAWMVRLLRHQNPDGGFGSMRGDDSNLASTASALIALGPDTSDKTRAPRALAVAWLKQKLSNSWVDDNERDMRAAAYAGLAAANAIDPASLHYFSDNSAKTTLSPQADADMAAAFKQIGDTNAAAFWIGKMNAAHPAMTIGLLDALAATDALPSNDVHDALQKTAVAFHHGTPPDFIDAAAMLRILAADDRNAGQWRLLTGRTGHNVTGVYAVRASDPVVPTLRNGDTSPVAVTFAAVAQNTLPSTPSPDGSVERHIYRLNGVELSPQTKPFFGETYLVELRGTMSSGGRFLLQDDADGAIAPIGCALPPKVDMLSFLPWLTTRDLSSFTDCEKTTRGIGIVLDGKGSGKFRAVYFANVAAVAVDALPPPQLRKIKGSR